MSDAVAKISGDALVNFGDATAVSSEMGGDIVNRPEMREIKRLEACSRDAVHGLNIGDRIKLRRRSGDADVRAVFEPQARDIACEAKIVDDIGVMVLRVTGRVPSGDANITQSDAFVVLEHRDTLGRC